MKLVSRKEWKSSKSWEHAPNPWRTWQSHFWGHFGTFHSCQLQALRAARFVKDSGGNGPPIAREWPKEGVSDLEQATLHPLFCWIHIRGAIMGHRSFCESSVNIPLRLRAGFAPPVHVLCFEFLAYFVLVDVLEIDEQVLFSSETHHQWHWPTTAKGPNFRSPLWKPRSLNGRGKLLL